MPIIIPKDIPAFSILTDENIFVMEKARAIQQDIRPIEIAVVNLMPTKVETETQLLRLLSNSPLQVHVSFIKTATYRSKNTSVSHLDRFYITFDEIKDKHFDGMIITGAPVELLDFEQVEYWNELTKIMDYADTHVTSTINVCWGAQASLYYHYGIQKHPLNEKLFGVFANRKVEAHDPLLKGVDDIFYIPNSRHTYINDKDIENCDELVVLAKSRKAGVTVVKSKDNHQIFLMGHSEYDRDTLKKEYYRDVEKGLPIKPPVNYFADSNKQRVKVRWTSFANLLFTNWLNYYVYQVTPYEL